MDYDQLIERYNSIRSIGLLGALQVCPQYGDKILRFEEMAANVLMQFHPKDTRPPVFWDQLMEAIENYGEGTGGKIYFPLILRKPSILKREHGCLLPPDM